MTIPIGVIETTICGDVGTMDPRPMHEVTSGRGEGEMEMAFLTFVVLIPGMTCIYVCIDSVWEGCRHVFMGRRCGVGCAGLLLGKGASFSFLFFLSPTRFTPNSYPYLEQAHDI